MSITIGNQNWIKNSVVAENCSDGIIPKKKNFFQNHPFLIGILISVIAGFILMFSFWEKIRLFIEGLFS